MPEEAKKVAQEAEAKVPETVPAEEYKKLYEQALELDSRYKRLVEAYNALFELYLAHK